MKYVDEDVWLLYICAKIYKGLYKKRQKGKEISRM